MHELIFLDTETTGNDVATDRLSQVCYKTSDGIYKGYFKPPVPMSVKAMSITNITNKMLADKEPFKGSAMMKDLEARLAEGILVAHNAKFDCAILEAEGMSIPRRICTFRVARELDPESQIPEYSLQYLRYFLDLDVEDAPAHDAEGDVKVLYALYKRLLAKMTSEGIGEEQAIEKMMDISSHPSLFKVFNFGKYKDKKIGEVVKTDRGYLQWMLDRKYEDGGQDEDWIHTLEYYLSNR
ncbi:MAG: hypothetical protein KGI60_00770 [Patescibacteria group bacterium]|nr:hypothetical protein [Patescibacteria group bacterium]